MAVTIITRQVSGPQGTPGASPASSLSGTLGRAVKIMFLGDSNMSGSNGDSSGFVGVGRDTCFNQLRSLRSDFDAIGSQIATPESHGTPLWFHEGHPGFTIANITAAYASYIATAGVGAPDMIVLSIGTNDITAGRTLLQMQTDYTSLLAQIRTSSPNATVLHLGVLPFVPGTTTGANQATWDALRVSFNAWISGTFIVTNPQLNQFVDVSSTFTVGDYQADGVHLNQTGLGRWGQALALKLDPILGQRSSTILPATYRQIQPWYSLLFPGTGDGASVAGHAGFNPGSTSFAFSVDYYPTSLDAAALHTIAAYGAYGASNFWLLAQQGQGLALYFNAAGGTIVGAVPYNGGPWAECLVLNRWHRLTFICDIVSLTASLFVNGICVGVAALPTWAGSFTQQTFYLGSGPTFSGAPGYYSRPTAYQGLGIPVGGRMAGQLAIEADLFDGASLAPGTISAYYSLNNNLTIGCNLPSGAAEPALVLGGNAAFAAPWPNGSPRRPWEIGDALAQTPSPPVSITPLTTTGGVTSYTSEQLLSDTIEVSGVLTSNATINLPVTFGKRRTITNLTTGAFSLTVQPTGGTGFVIAGAGANKSADGVITGTLAAPIFRRLSPDT